MSELERSGAVGSGGVATLAEFRAALDVVDRLGWDSQAGVDLLSYARDHVVGPIVWSRGLFGDAYEDATSAGWLAAWEALRSPAIRTSSSPWGSVGLAVLRGVKGAFVAKIYKASVRASWRRFAAGRTPEPDVAAACVSLEREVEKGNDFANSAAPVELGRRLELICAELVAAGWESTVAEEALAWVASNYSGSPAGTRTVEDPSTSQARTPAGDLVDAEVAVGDAVAYPNLRCSSCPARVVAGRLRASRPFFRLLPGESHAGGCENAVRGGVRVTRFAAAKLHVPVWQLGRLALVVGGGAGYPGLLELMALQGQELLEDKVARRALRSTARRSAACPSVALAAQYGAVRQLCREAA